MASSSQMRSRVDRKTHMFSILALPAWRPAPKTPGADSYRIELCISGVPVARAAQPGLSHSSSRRYPQCGALITTSARLVLARRGEHDIVQFLGAGQHGDQHFCLRHHLSSSAARAAGTLPLTVDLTNVTNLASAGIRALYRVREQLDGGSNPAPVCVLDWWAGIFDRPG